MAIAAIGDCKAARGLERSIVARKYIAAGTSWLRIYQIEILIFSVVREFEIQQGEWACDEIHISVRSLAFRLILDHNGAA